MWDEMDKRVRGRRNAPATLDQLIKGCLVGRMG
jgi:hypothetical protein